jgi:hypothetical protein
MPHAILPIWEIITPDQTIHEHFEYREDAVQKALLHCNNAWISNPNSKWEFEEWEYQGNARMRVFGGTNPGEHLDITIRAANIEKKHQ